MHAQLEEADNLELSAILQELYFLIYALTK